MNENNIKLLMMWYQKCKLYYNCHRDTTNYFIFWNRVLEFPIIIINVFNTTSLFVTYQQIVGVYILVIAGLSLVGSMLSASQSFLHLKFHAIKHKRLMIEYSRIIYSIEKIIILIKNNKNYKVDDTHMDSILNSIERAREEHVQFPEYIWSKYNKKFQDKLDNLDIDTSDSIQIILQSIKENKDLSVLLEESSKNSKDTEIITYSNGDLRAFELNKNKLNLEHNIDIDIESKV
jgi:antitoxin component of RelBE/YafQ-DinJ toxin-antitoxin module